MKTKAQKIEAVKDAVQELKKSETVILVDFTGTSVNKLNELRKLLRTIGAPMQVVKKRLLKIIFGEEKIDFDPKKFQGQTGVVFSPKDVSETASLVYKFTKANKDLLKISGGLNVKEKTFWSGAEILAIGKLPSREVLLSQLVGMLSMPIKMFMHVLNERAKKVEAK
ncbi:MAG: 50S ribosomal protein L10 [Patescibacteria group bacterium]